ncbi:uncharacterized protein LOC113236094, partial [Hyposmocoma kahamanoa]|uniref:uncharacterized protein LOC113236094 n=1 Tax=Hyposmocoma kahamanoa TaxID=1477025 RepID=UPI000E6D7314
KIQEAANSYADVSGKLVYMIGRRNRKLNPDKENEIIDLARDVGDMTTLLLVKATELTAVADDDPQSNKVDDAGVACADAARDLLVCAQLSAPTIYEPHCQTAITASAEILASSAQHLTTTWKPLVEDPARHQIGEELSKGTLDLTKALERLKAAYANLGDDDVFMQEPEDNPAQLQRLRFITSVNTTKNAMKDAQEELNKPTPLAKLTDQQADELQNKVSQKMGQINAAVASLLQAKSDPNNPDYNTAELAMTTISELMPEVIKDINKLCGSCSGDRMRQAMLNDVRSWCDGISDVCDCAAADDQQALDEAAKRFAKASRKLSFVFSPLANKAREQLLLELFTSAHNQALKLADDSCKMADALGGAGGARLRERSGLVADNARVLRTAVELTAPSIHDPRCQSALLSSTETLAVSAQRLVSETVSLQDDETGCRILEVKLHQQRAHIQMQEQMLQKALQGIRDTFSDGVVVQQ